MHLNDWDAIDPIRSIVAAGTTDLNALRDPDRAFPVPSTR
jgi:hypothetical protein